MNTESKPMNSSTWQKFKNWWKENQATAATFAAIFTLVVVVGERAWEFQYESQKHEISILKERVDRFEYLSSEFNNAMTMFTMTVVNSRRVDDELKMALLKNVAMQHTELVRLNALLSENETELANRYSNSLSSFESALQDTNGFLEMDPTYESLKKLMLDRETLVRALQARVVNLG